MLFVDLGIYCLPDLQSCKDVIKCLCPSSWFEGAKASWPIANLYLTAVLQQHLRTLEFSIFRVHKNLSVNKTKLYDADQFHQVHCISLLNEY